MSSTSRMCYRFNEEQLLELENTFKLNRYPTSKIKSDLAFKLKVTKNQVDTWFQNRRATTKQGEEHCRMKNKIELLQNEVLQLQEKLSAAEKEICQLRSAGSSSIILHEQPPLEDIYCLPKDHHMYDIDWPNESIN